MAPGAQALGPKGAPLNCIGDDWIGAQIRERPARGDVEFAPPISPAGTRRAVNLMDAAGRRTSFYDGRDPAELRVPRDHYLPWPVEVAGRLPHRAAPPLSTAIPRSVSQDRHVVGSTW